MDVMHSCLCCLRCPPDKDLTSPYTHHDKTEIYSDMLKECFNIQMVLDGWDSCGICSTCADRLRDASHFKQQVQRCQEELRACEQANDRVKDELLEPEVAAGDGASDDEESVLPESSFKLEPAEETELMDELLEPEVAAGDGASDNEESVLPESSFKLEPAEETELMDELLEPEVAAGDGASDNIESVLPESSVKLEPADETELSVSSPVSESTESSVLLRARQQLAAACAVRLERLRESRTPAPQHTYCCDMCMALFKAKSILVRHIRSHSGYEVCKKTSMMSSCLSGLEPNCTENTPMKHKLTETSTLTRSLGGEVLYSCDECGKGFKLKSSLRRHIQRSHSTEMSLAKHKPFQCRHCAYKTSYKTLLNDHQRIHTGEMFKCGYCNYKSCYKGTLQRHQGRHTREEPFEKPFKCGFCDVKCSNKSSLHVHQRIHTVEKSFKCGYCDHKSRNRIHLIMHQRIHTGEKPFKCVYCDFKCSDKSSLHRHQRIHTGEKPFKCGYCDYKSRDRSNLIKHQRIHTGEKPFKCMYCDFKCSRKTSLQRHQRRHIK